MYLLYIRSSSNSTSKSVKNSTFPCTDSTLDTIVVASIQFDPRSGKASNFQQITSWDETGNQAGGPNPDPGKKKEISQQIIF